MLAILTTNGKFVLDTDASVLAIGGELSQIQDGHEWTIAFAISVLFAEQHRYCTTRKELLVKFTRQFRHYLLGLKFTFPTDYHSLTWLVNFRHPEGQMRVAQKSMKREFDLHSCTKKYKVSDLPIGAAMREMRITLCNSHTMYLAPNSEVDPRSPSTVLRLVCTRKFAYLV